MLRGKKKKAYKAVDEYLRQRCDEQYITLWCLSVVADKAVGKELFTSLYDYEDIMPGPCMWVAAEKLGKTLDRYLGGNFLAVKNPYYRKTA